MDLIGKTTINPIFFYSGKILGYITWIIQFLLLIGIQVITVNTYKYNEYISYSFLFVGLFFVVLSMFNLGKSTRFGLPKEDTVFKTNGLYKISRNPMYVGFDLLTISSMVYTLNLWILVLGAYSLLIYHLIILGEEKFLKDRFGDVYFAYKQKVRRYL
jgi:protein-S-isoprenylcysteine O-methyltransferase Ste14